MPENTEYLVMGLAVIFTIFAGFVASMVVRYSQVRRDLVRLEQLIREEKRG